MKKVNRNHLLILFYQIMVFNTVLEASQFSNIPFFSFCTRILLVSLLIAGVIVWASGKGRVDKTLVLVIMIILGIALVVMKKSNSRFNIIMLLYMMIIYRDVEPQQFCKKYVQAATTAMIFVFVLCLMGVFSNEYRYRITSSGLTKYRYYLGFNNTTVSPNYSFHISLAYMFYKQEKFSIKDAFFVFIPNTIVFFLTDTRAAYFECIFAMMLIWLIKFIRKGWIKKVIGYLSLWSMPFFAGMELYIANSYTTSKPFYLALDEVLSHRFSWVVRALKDYPIGLFGNPVTWESTAYTETSQLVDMFYLRCAIQYGLVFLFVIIIGFVGMSAYFKVRENYYGCIIIMVLAIHSITDPQLLEYSYVPLLVMLLPGYEHIAGRIKIRRKIRKKGYTDNSQSNNAKCTIDNTY